jgi:hypothetical protein
MARFKDLKGQKFGKLTCIKPVGKSKTRCMVWLCKCECGEEIEVVSNSLLTGNTKSCSCLQKDTARHECKKRTKHGLSPLGLCNRGAYKSWAHMKQRCLNKNCASYKDYGGRGISACDKWLTFEGFWDDMGPTYQEGLTIERIDVNGNYEPDNCRWATKQEQAENKRNNVYITYNNQTKTVAQWARDLNVKATTIYQRIQSGWSNEKLLMQPRLRKPTYIT